ncbi:Hypothetical protein, putative [Bodo saltans]|uniref:Uncharacterized protein n=1 Tax=Bodo saltans TaxID=75058 RepID=A0A0S4INZ5_BODSA|nr:Hypothetical protein, putative [Bodo saltans]|eukprot:CUE86720.1 Hypothetical protein, putative [Bodo saltans]
MEIASSLPTIVIMPGEKFRVLASGSTLRKHLTDAYWCTNMEMVCDGKLDGEVVRFTGKDLVMMRFPSTKNTRSGRRYDYAFSIPAQYLVPVSFRRALGASLAVIGTSIGSSPEGSPLGHNTTLHHVSSSVSEAARFGQVGGSSAANFANDTFIPHLCVVCGRFDLPGEVRRHGYKCNGCIGIKSVAKLRTESIRLKTEVES